MRKDKVWTLNTVDMHLFGRLINLVYSPVTLARFLKDGMLDHENEELRERVSALEKKVHQNEDEMLCLKSALADALRRIASLESGRTAGLTNNVLPSKPFKPQPRRVSSAPVSAADSRSKRAGSVEQAFVTRDTAPPQKRAPTPTPKAPPSPSPTSLKKWSSLSSAEFQGGNLQMSRSFQSVTCLTDKTRATDRKAMAHRRKETTFNKEEGYLRMYLRGRPVTLYAPTLEEYDLAKKEDQPPQSLKLEWVYGYRGRDCRSNVHLLPTGETVYFVAGVVVLYNVEEQIQRHYLGHTDDVKCLAVHPDKITIATGQVAGHDNKKSSRPHVRVWNSVSLQTLHILGLGGDFDRAVCSIGFSKADGGQLLCAVDEGNEHTLSVWEWQKGEKGHKITETKSSTEPVVASEFHPLDANTIITCGKNQITFWTLEGGTLGKKLGLFEKHEKPKFVLCLAIADNGDVFTGDSNGNIFIWPRGTNKISKALTGVHEGGIFSLLFTKDGHLLSGGGKDRRIVQWDATGLTQTGEVEIPEHYGAVRTLTQGKGNMIVVGSTRNVILQGTLELNFNPIVQGHVDELWGLAVHPNQHQFLTCAYDKKVFLWDALSHSAVWSKELEVPAHCACFHPDAQVVAIGTQTAKWLVLDLTSREPVYSHTDGNEQIECAEYSPDGKYLALGSRDNHIYVYSVDEEGKKYSRVGKCQGHSSFVTHLDWSADSQYIQSNSGDYELLFWNASSCKQITASSSMRDVQWATSYCTISFNTCGIWPEGADGTDVNGSSRAHKADLLASADDYGKVNLYRYPSTHIEAGHRAYGGHSSHVTAVRFLHDDSRLLSTGGKDAGILQWEIL
ncbi:echinoderm microtubule-associated protein-like 2 isoform X3 [Lingula anatina]|uniref:Echinoderm microtubule-associated protein-like 2 isoform X3 n=1 Tax=Lingula anatina TaxID=7574 RepID=A0A1S3IBB1_LINAN|nr:echinoderm microtubule-associated protein-like 2 isoform X3 [Lingula anatina]|eukprot:XP_013395547.1 echinoderm microtubule-associated protein-like 2 isoform X3 [Lingula anatina]